MRFNSKSIPPMILGFIVLVVGIIAYNVISSPTQQGADQALSQQSFTLQDVAAHSTQDSCWLVIDGNIYDVTTYISIHPGGPNRIISYCGKDATTAFETKGGTGVHSAFAHKLLQNFLVGSLSS